MIVAINEHEKEVYCIEFYLGFDMVASIRHQPLKPTEDCQLGTISTYFIRNSCGTEDITSRIRPSSSSKVVGFGRVDLLFHPTPNKKVTGCLVRTSDWPLMQTTTTHPSPREVGIHPFTNNNCNVLRSAMLHEN